MQKVSDEYMKSELISRPGERLHRLYAMLCDTYYDDLTDARIEQLEEQVESFRWMNASGERVDRVC